MAGANRVPKLFKNRTVSNVTNYFDVIIFAYCYIVCVTNQEIIMEFLVEFQRHCVGNLLIKFVISDFDKITPSTFLLQHSAFAIKGYMYMVYTALNDTPLTISQNNLKTKVRLHWFPFVMSWAHRWNKKKKRNSFFDFHNKTSSTAQKRYSLQHSLTRCESFRFECESSAIEKISNAQIKTEPTNRRTKENGKYSNRKRFERVAFCFYMEYTRTLFAGWSANPFSLFHFYFTCTEMETNRMELSKSCRWHGCHLPLLLDDAFLRAAAPSARLYSNLMNFHFCFIWLFSGACPYLCVCHSYLYCQATSTFAPTNHHI